MKETPDDILRRKGGARKISALTAYDYPMTRLVDEAGVDVILVGDSLGMVVLGFPDTTHVTMGHMIHHTRAAARAKPRALLAADLPYRSYETAEQAVQNAAALMQAGAEAVKLEGGREVAEQVKAIRSERIPLIGHLGMLPQHVLEEGGYRIKGRTEEQARRLLDDAAFLAEEGACAIVLELVTPEVAAEVTRTVGCPTIGIGSGPGCDGQILVTHDLVGLFPWFTPKFVTPQIHTGESIRQAATDWRASLGGT